MGPTRHGLGGRTLRILQVRVYMYEVARKSILPSRMSCFQLQRTTAQTLHKFATGTDGPVYSLLPEMITQAWSYNAFAAQGSRSSGWRWSRLLKVVATNAAPDS